MDLRDIEYFAVIAEHGHLGRAAEALGLGQPALSISLRRLENSAEAKLVKRTPKGVELTDIGRALLSHVRQLKLAREDLAREISDLAHGQAGHLRVGASPATARGILADACSTLLKDAPRITLDISIAASTDTLLQALRKGELDIIVPHMLNAPPEGVVREPLWEDEFVVYASVRHRLARRKSVALADLVHERWTATAASAILGQQSLRRTFEARGLPMPQIALTSDSAAMNHRLVASSGLLGIASRRPLEQDAGYLGLKIIPVTDVKWIRPVFVVYRKDGYLSPVAKRLIEILKATAKEIAMEKP
jgi:DNA-binding transcriptional LysR family regulator